MLQISVIIPVYNASELIDRCLDSIFNQTKNDNIEVILVDDGSTDNSVEIIKNRKEQDRIRLFQQTNSGPSKARNKGIAEARGKYLAFLDADDYWLPGFLEETVKFLDNHEDCIAVSTAQRHLTTTGVHEAPTDWRSLATEEGAMLTDFYDFWSRHNHICTGSILIRSHIAKATAGMREDLRICEDLEFWAFLASFGKMGYIPKLLFVSDGSKVTQKIGWINKNLPRWNGAVPLDVWESRIVTKQPDLLMNSEYLKARGRIAKNLAYSILMSKRYSLAKREIKLYKKYYPHDRLAMLLRLAVRNQFNWLILSRLLVYREYHRK